MSLPGNRLSSASAPLAFLPPDDVERRRLREDLEMGGVAINDPSEGLAVRLWRAHTDGSSIWVAPHPEGAPLSLRVAGAGITEVSLAFDQNMQPAIGFVEAGVMKLNWFDSTVEGFTTTVFAGNSPRLALDDKRAFNVANSDVLFFYTRAGKLCYRQQRERYTVERQLADVLPDARIGRVGMGAGNRLQIEVQVPYRGAHTALASDTLYAVAGNSVLPLFTGDVATSTWRGRAEVDDGQPSMAWARVDAAGPVELRLYAEGAPMPFFRVQVVDDAPLRLPPECARELVVEVVGDARLFGIYLASSLQDLEAADGTV